MEWSSCSLFLPRQQQHQPYPQPPPNQQHNDSMGCELPAWERVLGRTQTVFSSGTYRRLRGGDLPFAAATMNVPNALPADLRRRSCQWRLARALSACHALFFSLALPAQSGKRTQPRNAP